ncbi:YceI family protein [Membranihabitans marinus]|uniref:YceI family protein n=1 Tax=Membranihabitans marinus TaxID=1227546 RepID=UPI001F3DFA56|nr:YceI family protein [Membranihabitans marinus]
MIKKYFLALIISLTFGWNLQGQDATMWTVDKAHTSVNFGINHFFNEVKGKFTEFDGSFHFDPDQLNQSGFSFIIQVKSVDTDNEKRDNHLQSADFFNAEQFPEIKFVSTKVEMISENKYQAMGNLTIKDVTKNIVIPFSVTGQMEHPMMEGNLILGLRIDTTLDRTDYGVGVGDWAATMVVGDEVRINIPMELNRKVTSK